MHYLREKGFYSLVANSLENGEMIDNNIEEGIINNSNYIDGKILDLEKVANVLYTKRDFGLSLQEMYEKTKVINSKEDPRYEEFLRFRKKNKFNGFTYFEIRKAVSEITDDIIQSFITYSKLNKENGFIDDIDLSMNLIDIEEFKENIKKIILPVKKITDKAKENKELHKSLMDEFKVNSYRLNDEKAEKLAIRINEFKNSHLLDKINLNKWWSISYWISYSKNKKIEIENQNKFEENKKLIINKVMDMTHDINSSFKDMAIIQKALNEGVYDIVVEELLKGEDLTEYFNDIIEALDLGVKYKRELKLTRELNDLKIKVLDYSIDDNLEIARR